MLIAMKTLHSYKHADMYEHKSYKLSAEVYNTNMGSLMLEDI